jgi:superoxide reductase
MSVKFYVCERCGNIVEKIKDSGVTPHCCGQKMTELVAGTVEASREKHIPVVNVSEGAVEVLVGSVLHPMAEETMAVLPMETIQERTVLDTVASDQPVTVREMEDYDLRLRRKREAVFRIL